MAKMPVTHVAIGVLVGVLAASAPAVDEKEFDVRWGDAQ